MFDLQLDVFEDKLKKPSNLSFIYYLFFEHGVSLERFEELPIPYILQMVNTHNYIKEKEQEEIEKSKHGTN